VSASNLTIDYPKLESELQKRHQNLDMQIEKIVAEKGYLETGSWEGYPIYAIPVSDLLGVRSATFCRRKAFYRPVIVDMVEETFIQKAPLLCFVAGDLMLRVKWGNIIYWAAKETKKISYLSCIFPGDPEKTELLKSKLLEEYKIPAISFL